MKTSKRRWLMVKNDFRDLSKKSIVRIDALNSIKYTLLLNYELPEWTNDDSLIPNVIKQCNICCYGLFDEDSSSYACFNFFGTLYDIQNNSFFKRLYSYPNPTKYEAETPGIPDLILQHCLFSSYHALLTEFLNTKNITSYTLANKIQKKGMYALFGPKYNKCKYPHSLDSASKRVPNATLLSQKTTSHKSALSEVFSLLATKGITSKSYNYFLHFSNISFALFNIKPSTFSLENNSYPLTRLMNTIPQLEPPISSLEIPDTAFSDYGRSPIDGLYFYYLMERFSNIRLTYSLLRQIENTERNYHFQLSNKQFLDILSLCYKLPNVFSRQYFIKFAFDAFKIQPQSYTDFWTQQSLERNSVMGFSMRGVPSGFQFPRWLEQYTLFINYMAEFVIPIYEWCFMNMLLDSVEAKYPNEDHNNHIKYLLQKLASYVNNNYHLIHQPIKFTKDQDLVDILSPINNWQVLKNLSPDTIQYLWNKLFFLGADQTGSINRSDINLNLSNINPAYFKIPTQEIPNNNASRIRKFYLDLIKLSYLQPED